MGKLLFLLFILVSCGQNVQLKGNQLESFSQITESDGLKLDQTGVLIKTQSSSTLTAGGKTYTIHKGSSYLAFEFINRQPVNSQSNVKFKGIAKGNEILLELIE